MNYGSTFEDIEAQLQVEHPHQEVEAEVTPVLEHHDDAQPRATYYPPEPTVIEIEDEVESGRGAWLRPMFPLDVGRVVVPASLMRISISFSVLYTVVSLAQKYGFTAKTYLPSLAVLLLLVTIDQLRYCEFGKRRQFTVFSWAGVAMFYVSTTPFFHYAIAVSVVLYGICRVNSHAHKFLMADCAMGAIATWLFI